MTDYQAKFQKLLRELFQFDVADLDFGIYRIMNHKRQVIERFVSEDLPKAIMDELAQGALAEGAQAAKDLDAARKKVLDALGEDALDAVGNLADSYHNTKAGKEYIAAQENAKSAKGHGALEATIYNHLYTFFSRYYQDGDFISKRRYSRKERYAIPYNGEEVHLYWANHDQYYVKTGEYFNDYTWQATGGLTVHFKLKAADVEQNNVKGDKRYFMPRFDEMEWSEQVNQLTIPFEFRPLTEQENIKYGKKNQQEAINAQASTEISKKLSRHPQALAALTAEKRQTDKGEIVTYLDHHLRQYTRRNTNDFFIHKNLHGFLSRELDFYLKNEVLNLEEMEIAGEGLSQGWFQLLCLIKKVGGRIIEFLAQIENFQKMLWEKRKFVTEVFYCITLGQIDERFYPEIVACDAQWEEWNELFSIDEGKGGKGEHDRRVKLLKENPTLLLDSRRLSPDFTDRLLASFTDLDERTDGLLVKGENWQVLNLLIEKYREKVKCIYIDPPYNTGKDGFPYKDQYQHSSWLSMLLPRISSSFSFLTGDGVLFTSLDRNEFASFQTAVKQSLPFGIQVGELVWHNARDNNPTQIALEHEYIICFGKSSLVLNIPWKSPFSYAKETLSQEYESLKAQGFTLGQIQREIRSFIKINREMLGEIERYKHVDEYGVYTGSESVHNPHPGGYSYEIPHPVTMKSMRKPANGYRFPESTMLREFIEKDRLIYGPDENRIVGSVNFFV